MPEKKPSLPGKREKRARQQKNEKVTLPSSKVRRATNSKRSAKRQTRSLQAGLAVMGGRAAGAISRRLHLGGGTSIQKKAGVEDSPDLVFRDLTDWSLTEPNGYADYRFNDREIMRAFADNCAQTFEFLVSHGVKFVNDKPDGRAGSAHGNSVPRQMHVAVLDWPEVETGKQLPPAERATASNGNGLMLPLEKSYSGVVRMMRPNPASCAGDSTGSTW